MRSLSLLLAFASLLALPSLAVSPRAAALDKLSPLVRESLSSPSAGEIKIWVFFADHGEATAGEVDRLLSQVTITDRSRERRLHRSSGPIVDNRDLPVNASYVRALDGAGFRVKRASKYLNAVSGYATADEIQAMAKLPFVARIDRVRTARREMPRIEDPAAPGALPSPGTGPLPSTQSLDYGLSYGQLNLIDVIPIHNANIFGQGVLVAMLDTGFNRSHDSLDHLDVVAEWDFIQNDAVTKDQAGDPSGQHNHGTMTLSALAGYAPGNLIGPAFEASFALAKTERYDMEIQSEEDDYVAGLEWADSLGADLVSSSLGYLDWYTYADMDGNTAVTTVAADIAVSKGMAVITAAGNEGPPLPWPGIIAPADGDSVVAVGAVWMTGVIADFSSRGPTYDGRIKPDVCAQGVAVRCANPYDSLGYTSTSGTSLATPLVAGAAALCLQMHPSWSPVTLRNALRASANRAAHPDNDYGWGVIDAYQTALNGATGIASRPTSVRAAGILYQNAPNPFVPSASGNTTIRFRVGADESVVDEAGNERQAVAAAHDAADVTLAIYDVSGRLVRRLVAGRRNPGEYAAEWNGLDERGVAVSSSVYYYRLSVGGFSASRKMVLIRR